MAADEYDSYLLHIAARLQDGEAEDELVHYLIDIETEHMGLSPSATAQSRARATVQSIQRYVEGLA